MTDSWTDSVTKSERKTISLDLDDKNALPKQISLTEPIPTLKKKMATHSNKEKEKKPSTKEKKVKPGGDTSIIDSILKKNKVATLEKKEHVNNGVTGESKKKMILDLNSGEQIITQDTKPVPEIKPALQFVQEKPKATIILKSEARKQNQVNAPTPESQYKLDTVFNIDSANKSWQTQSVASVITEQHNSLPIFSPPSYGDSTIQNTGHTQLSPEASVRNIDYVKELKEIDEQLAKIRAKLAKRGPDAKYLEMQQKLEERRAKYIRRQQRQEAVAKPKTINPVPWGADLSYTPTLLRESITRTPLGCTSNWDSAVPSAPYVMLAQQLFKTVKTPTKTPDLLDEVNFELSKAKDMLTSIEHNQDVSNSNTHQPTLSSAPSRKVIKEQGTSIFAIPSELTSMREKKEHLLAEQRKIAERIGHRQKQIDKLKNWQREVEQMNQLQAEKQKIFDLQKDLKLLEKQQYEQDQKLKGQMYQVRKMAHSKSNELKRLDMIDTFKVVKQRSQSVPVTQPSNLNQSVSTNTLVGATQLSSGFSAKLRAAINSLFAGERVMFTKNNTIQAKDKQIEPVCNIIITEDAKTGLEYKTACTNIDTDTIPETSSTLPVTKINDVIDLAKQFMPEVNNANPISSETQISEHQINVYRDYFCDKVGISKNGIGKCFELIANKDANHTATLVNVYKEICDEIRFG